MKFILGPLLIVIGVLMMKYTVWITNQVGRVDMADRYLPWFMSGTYSWWRIVGFLMIVVSLLWMGGFLDFGTANIEIPQ